MSICDIRVGQVADRGVSGACVPAQAFGRAAVVVGGRILLPWGQDITPENFFNFAGKMLAFRCNLGWETNSWQWLQLLIRKNSGTAWAESGIRDDNSQFRDCPGKSATSGNPNSTKSRLNQRQTLPICSMPPSRWKCLMMSWSNVALFTAYYAALNTRR